MKQLFLIPIILGMVCFCGSAQVINFDKNAFQSGDSLIKCELKFKDPGISGKKVIWNYTQLNEIQDDYILSYKVIGDTNDSICGTEHRTKYYYKVDSKGISCVGFENPYSKIHYSKPLPIIQFPFRYGDSIRFTFEGLGEYGYGIEQRVIGIETICADAIGTLILPTETVKALRVKSVREYSPKGSEGTNFTQIKYSWYSEKHRYPIFESVQTLYYGNENKDTLAFNVSFYYKSARQEQRMIENNEDFIDIDNNDNAAVLSDIKIHPNPVKDNVIVTFNLNMSTQVSIRIYANTGALLYNSENKSYNIGNNTEQIAVNNLNNGTYIVCVSTDDSKISSIMIKK